MADNLIEILVTILTGQKQNFHIQNLNTVFMVTCIVKDTRYFLDLPLVVLVVYGTLRFVLLIVFLRHAFVVVRSVESGYG